MTERILIVDDEGMLADNIQTYLTKLGYQTEIANNYNSALELINNESFDVVITDLMLPDGNGSQLLELGQKLAPECIFLIMTGHASLESALTAFKNGAHDYLLKPFSLKELGIKIDNITRFKRIIKQNKLLRQEIMNTDNFDQFLIGNSPSIKHISLTVKEIAPTTSTVLITGESGTGKELVARALHTYSNRSDETFYPLNVAAIPDDLIESNLFGHVKGAFTGAIQPREGAFRSANRGTLFLDEIGDLSLLAQAKLLRVLEDQEIFPVGSDKSIKINIRLVAATNHNLVKLAEKKLFREDLLFRLNVMNINIPPLRERLDDIPSLVYHLLEKHRQKTCKMIIGVEQEIIHALMGYSWKGNVRELSNVIERAMLLCKGDKLTLNDLPVELQSNNDIVSSKLTTAVEQFKYQHIVSVLTTVDYNREHAANVLGVSEATLYREMDKLGLKGFRGLND